MFVWMCVCLFGLLYSCVISAQGDFVCALCVWLGFCCIGIPVFCVCMSVQTYQDARQVIFPVYCSLFFTPLYLLFSEGSLQ